MGYMRHHAIVVTSWKDELISTALACAASKGGTHRPAGDAQRSELVEWLDAQRYDDGSTSIGWVEVQFDDDDDDTHIVRDSSERRRQLYHHV